MEDGTLLLDKPCNRFIHLSHRDVRTEMLPDREMELFNMNQLVAYGFD